MWRKYLDKMSKLMFASKYSRRISGSVTGMHELGIDFDEVILNCNLCGKATTHSYAGYASSLSDFSLKRTMHNYKCVGCGTIQSFKERK